MKTLTEFVSSLKTLARPNRFQAYIFAPNKFDSKLTLWCRSVSIPPIQNNVEKMMYFGKQIVIPGDFSFGQVTLTFLLDSGMEVRQFFIEWHKIALLNYNDRMQLGSLEDIYSGKIIVHQLDEKNVVSREFKFFGVVPTTIGSLNYDMNSDSQILTLEVTFEYLNFEESYASEY